MKNSIKISIGLATVTLATLAVAPLNVDAASSKTVTVGVVGDTSRELWQDIGQRAQKKYGITIKLKEFNDYVKPNQALVDGSLDLNAFQTKIFFDDQNKKMGNKLQSIGKTVIVPMRLYSLKADKISEIKKGSTIAVPNDATNEARALNVLVQAKLIKYNKQVTDPTAKDITYNPKNLKIKEVDAGQAVSSLQTADAAVINGNFAHDANLKDKNILLTQNLKKNVSPYINLIAALKSEANKKVYNQIVKLYQTKETKAEIKKLFGNSQYAAWNLK
ncbi:MetQ/NlpA family ABC transporter substrate-binding protein [Weissella paramesenteroides]|uniref:MetQ/NlpA family ABC transporter substrate-binding protein n=1 Tax=Weissella paramesenteroides TaxID=1249 RepID=UPI00223B98B7|nr:MetQ/NlpA family ABC transporter substrate-binding protein [Weissella paramesenteroides]MCS9985109.1 MetQ/NlpA family ABC transporter substrate-binding protein [Weissella paramesenteroides]MCS9998032.1 MetQ/NlpA family ABC transporter substrate-binding protein [Weissella paramesenteroides]MCT0259686.1 MetQ/NlpA family ABC transporter substrate-binding protein [Weissella paramesenteroides]